MSQPPGRGRRSRWAVRLVLLFALGSLGVKVGNGQAQPARIGRRFNTGPAAAEPLLRSGVAALAAGELAVAEKNLEAAYVRWPSPILLYHLGVLAFKKGQLLAAQDLLRRYQSDPASITEAAMEQEIRRVLLLPRPPAGKAVVLSDSGALLRVDNRIVGSLPLVQPLLLSPESHQISVIFPEQTLNSQVEVPVGRLAELRVNRGSRAVLLTLLPAYIVLPDYRDLGAEMEHQVDDAIEHAFQSEKKSVLRRDFALRKAPELKECLNTLLCQDQLATKNDVDGLLAVRVAISTGGHKIALRLLDSATGDLAGHIEREVAPGLLLRQLQQDVTQLILDSAARTRGGLQVRTDPSGAQVYMGSRILGVTPYQRPSFTGRFELIIHKPGYDSVRQQIEVSEGRTTEVIVGMAHDLPEPPPMALRPEVQVATERTRKPRPTWRLVLGGAALSAGALVLGTGADALQLGNTCLDPGFQAPGALCSSRLQPASFGIGTITGGLLLIGAGITLIALPGPWQKIDTFTYSPAEPTARH